MATESDVTQGARLPNAASRGPTEPSAHWSARRRVLWLCVIVWTAVVGFAIWWLANGKGGPSVWVFQERDLSQPGLAEKVHAVFGSALHVQRSYPWLMFGPYLALVAWHFPLERGRLSRSLPLNAAACLAFACACHLVVFRTDASNSRVMVAPGAPPLGADEMEIDGITGQADGTDGPIRFRGRLPSDSTHPASRAPSIRAIVRSTILDLLAYGAVTGMVHSVYFHRRLRERERRALLLESNLAKARLNLLKAQLQPHFLFNSLNAIATLLRRDPRLAETTLVALSELLRLALSQSERQEGGLREELEFVRCYLDIQQTRFGDRLRVEQDIDPQALDCLVPTLVLQPLVENAIRHGIEPGEQAGLVRIAAVREVGRLILTVEDDGVGLADSNGARDLAGLGSGLPSRVGSTAASAEMARVGTGIGLSNLRDRLQALYGVHQSLELKSRAKGGVVVRVEIPWRSRDASETTDS